MAGDLVVSTINGGGIGTKNVIINGNFGINQRGVSGTVALAAGAYGHDRFKAGASGCTYTFATAANVTTLTITAGSLVQVIEGLNLQSGTYTMSWDGTAQGKINGGSYGASGITGSATGGANMSVEFSTGTLSLVQVEKGSTATPFEFRQYGTELQLCQRYYEKNYDLTVAVGANNPIPDTYSRLPLSSRYSGTTYASIPYKVPKRATPSLSFWGTTGTANSWSCYANGGSTSTLTPTYNDGGQYNLNLSIASSGSYDLVQGYWASSAEL